LGWVDRGAPEPPPNTHVISFGLCVVRMRFDTGQTEYRAALHDPAPDRLHPPVGFDDWWTRVVLRDQQGNGFSRADLVLALANKDGGAHIDTALNEKYRELTRENSLGFTQGPDQPIANSIVHASVRHIAGELVETIENGLVWEDDDAVVRDPVCPLPLGTEVPAGRNDACPCGGGRKFKRCFGQRQPLRRMAPPPETSEAGQTHPLPGSVSSPPGKDPLPSMILDCLLLVPVGEGV
ncbi:MAG TPA: SEC-C metal-binding domain-containing protein, partial [Solirubrobacteraceae bacterium]|nr:SEC-C metal-binding domain-containing protein [Solirubrobacteraceae bacterium]